MADSTLWSVTPASNDDADPSINWSEGQLPGTVNDSARNMMAVHAMRWLDETGYALSGGSSTAYTVTPQQTLTAYRDGLEIMFRAHAACGASPTLNVSSLGAKSILNAHGGTLGAGEITGNSFVHVIYSTALGNFYTVNKPTLLELTATLQAGGFFGIPVGFIGDTAAGTAPSGWLLCYGQNVSRTTYSALFNALSTNYGPGDGSTTFGIPDLRGTITAGLDNMGGADAARLDGALTISGGRTTLGGKMGEATHLLAIGSIPSITPSGTVSGGNLTTNGSAVGGLSGGGTTFIAQSGTPVVGGTTSGHVFSGTTFGGGGSHNNAQPTHMTNKIIFTGVA